MSHQSLGMGLAAAWVAMLLDWVVRAGLYWVRLKRGHWKKIPRRDLKQVTPLAERSKIRLMGSRYLSAEKGLMSA